MFVPHSMTPKSTPEKSDTKRTKSKDVAYYYGFNRRSTKYMTSVGNEEIDATWVIDIQRVQEKFKQRYISKRGYKGLAHFLCLSCWLLWLLNNQHQASALGEVNAAFRDAWAKSKADLKVKDSASLWKFFAASAIPLLLNIPWSEKTVDGDNVGGYMTMQYYYTIGGVAITGEFAKEKLCLRSQICYDQEDTKPVYSVTMGNVSVQLHQNDLFKGYTAFVPVTFGQAEISTLLAALTDAFVSPSLRHLKINTLVLNPSQKPATLTLVEFIGSIDRAGNVHFSQNAKTLPYEVYGNEPWEIIKVALPQVLMLIFYLIYFIWPYLQMFVVHHGTTHVNCQEDLMRHQRIWNSFPVSWTGEVYITLPMIMTTLILTEAYVWLRFALVWSNVDAGEELHIMPTVLDAGTDLAHLFVQAQDQLGNRFVPFNEKVFCAAGWFHLYFSLAVILCFVIILRLFQYLSFQRKLSIVTDTFNNIMHELVHIGSVFVFVTFACGVMCSLGFGDHDESFESFMFAFFEMILSCFGMFKPSATTPFIPPLFKYVPHVALGDQQMRWLPSLVMLFFKVLIGLLLFKLLIGIIMESYKTHRPKRADKIPNVSDEIEDLWGEFVDYYLFHKFLGYPFVSLEYMMMACNAIQRRKRNERKSRPRTDHLTLEDVWRERVIGLKRGAQGIVDALNEIRHSDKVSFVFGHIEKEFTMEHARWCLVKYGTSRSHAIRRLEGWYKERIEKLTLRKEACDKDTNGSKPSSPIIQKHNHEVDAHFLWVEGIRAFGVDPTPAPPSDEVDKVFDAFDFFGVGFIDMSQLEGLLVALGYDLTAIDERHLFEVLVKIKMENVDTSPKGILDLTELHKLLKDELMQTLYRCSEQPKLSRQWKLVSRKVQMIACPRLARRNPAELPLLGDVSGPLSEHD